MHTTILLGITLLVALSPIQTENLEIHKVKKPNPQLTIITKWTENLEIYENDKPNPLTTPSSNPPNPFVILDMPYNKINSISHHLTARQAYNNPMGRCECGVFQGITVTDMDVPFLTQFSQFSVYCNDFGQKRCMRICGRLDEAASSYGLRLLCEILGNYKNDALVSVQSRICGGKWFYTGLRTPNGLCCHKHLSIKCDGLL